MLLPTYYVICLLTFSHLFLTLGTINDVAYFVLHFPLFVCALNDAVYVLLIRLGSRLWMHLSSALRVEFQDNLSTDAW